MLVIGPSSAFATTSAFPFPLAINIISFDSRIVPTPIERANFGTSSIFSKNLELSEIVCSSSTTILVLDPRDEPGSLKAMCPSPPIPRTCKSIPPAF